MVYMSQSSSYKECNAVVHVLKVTLLTVHKKEHKFLAPNTMSLCDVPSHQRTPQIRTELFVRRGSMQCDNRSIIASVLLDSMSVDFD